MDNSIDLVLLERYFAGDCTPAEETTVTEWLTAHPERREEVEALRRVIDRVSAARVDIGDTDAAWARIRRPQRATPIPVLSERPRARRIGQFAAAAVVIAGAGWAVGHFSSRRAPLLREFATPAGTRATVTLRDGTQLVLGAASRLRVPADFGAQTRTVDLDGEAYFIVVHDAAHPFAVHASRAVVTDIGTQFDVHAYRDDRSVRVAVVEGRVGIAPAGLGTSATSLRHAPSALRLHDNDATASTIEASAGDVAVVDTAITVTHGADVAAMTAWMQGRIVFTDTPLRDVVRDLARAFNLDITVADSSLATQHVTGSYTDQPVDVILDDITAVIGARYERAGRTVVIRRGPAATHRDATPRPPVSLTQHQ